MSKHFNPMSRKHEESAGDGVSLGKARCVDVTRHTSGPDKGTTKAIRVRLANDALRWIPFSVIHADSEVYGESDSGNLIVLSWWASKEGLT